MFKNAEKNEESYEQGAIGPKAKTNYTVTYQDTANATLHGSKQHETETCQCLVLYYRSSLLSSVRPRLNVQLVG